MRWFKCFEINFIKRKKNIFKRKKLNQFMRHKIVISLIHVCFCFSNCFFIFIIINICKLISRKIVTECWKWLFFTWFTICYYFILFCFSSRINEYSVVKKEVPIRIAYICVFFKLESNYKMNYETNNISTFMRDILLCFYFALIVNNEI